MVTGLKGFNSLDKYGVDWNAPKNGLELCMTTYGHWGYRYPLIYLPAGMNSLKYRLLEGFEVIAVQALEDQIALALDQATGAPHAEFLTTILQRVSHHSQTKSPFLC